MNNERSLSEEITEGFKALDQLGLAASIIKQQKLEIDALKKEIEELKALFDKTLNNWAKDMERFRK